MRRFPNRALARWVETRGRGAISQLARETGRTWKAVYDVVWRGVVPRSDTLLLLAQATGLDASEIAVSSGHARRARVESEADR